MQQNNKAVFNFLVGLSGILLIPLIIQAKEVLTVEEALFKCKTTYPAQFESKKRLACFDSISSPTIEKATQNPPDADLIAKDNATKALSKHDATGVNEAEEAQEVSKSTVAVAVVKPSIELSYLERKWRLTSQGDWDISDFETYKANYLLITGTSNKNDTPETPNRVNNVDRNLDPQDLKFQLSLKSELLNNIPLIRNLPYVTSSRLWGAYTQQSYWQIFNGANSRPLRENDYEPEIILSLGIDNAINGVKKDYIPRMLNFGIVHQSNGQSNPLSRSWNRAYIEGGFELTHRISLMVRPWWRIPENKSQDDNPDIEKYLGYGDINLRWETEKHNTAVSLLLRNNLRRDNKGFAQIDLQQRVFNNPYLKLHLMLSSGFGETLLDYNHSQNILGLGISLGE